MFGNEFMERIEDRQVFQFDETTEHCTVDDFRIFLHYLSGCQSPSDCVRIDSVETCVSLLYVSFTVKSFLLGCQKLKILYIFGENFILRDTMQEN